MQHAGVLLTAPLLFAVLSAFLLSPSPSPSASASASAAGSGERVGFVHEEAEGFAARFADAQMTVLKTGLKWAEGEAVRVCVREYVCVCVCVCV